ncbi:Obg family GTPase CgtA [Candidatus Nitrosacidococcus sp. I8]|uniref:Obg family GTPase CgtA n=1 Tax=Candidatus Nitrosacidococcus sp. I8 TaxID=2942908 RepID=UPI00222696A6|nr:Obg family GTPase CgtA [Candidatus Nitrosacidococcus sp. I8]CAH9019833.1 GTPase Obg [Candidatus Nitrosacidococcus sp. I8]
MKFVDEAIIKVQAGAGGNGCLSFRREKFIPFGGPNGGNGGKGGDAYLIADERINTLIDFRHHHHFIAQRGESGRGKLQSGKSGQDLYIPVPVGTEAWELETGDFFGDLTTPKQTLLVAKGGRYGLGNAHFKSSTNRAPRKFTKGELGEELSLRLELKLLADVGLLGLPNAGKSTFTRQISAANPKVASYPFTTLYPSLGVVRVGFDQSFVIADIPGIIEGASQGTGLGIQFLKHLSRTRLLIHLVDILPDQADPITNIQTILKELEQFSPKLANQEQWLVFNKIDLLPETELRDLCKNVCTHLSWQNPVYYISSVTGQGCQSLITAIMAYLETASAEN